MSFLNKPENVTKKCKYTEKVYIKILNGKKRLSPSLTKKCTASIILYKAPKCLGQNLHKQS